MKSKQIIILFICAFLLTGCAANLKKVIPGAGTDQSTKETKVTESQKDTSTMTVDDMEKELNSMDDLNVDKDLGEIDKEL